MRNNNETRGFDTTLDSPADNVPAPLPGENAGTQFTRRRLLQGLSALGIGTAAFQRSLAAQASAQGEITAGMIRQAEWIAGLELDEEEREDIASNISSTLSAGQRLRETAVDADTVPALVFRPDFFYAQAESGNPATTPDSTASASHAATVQVAWSLEQNPRSLSESELAFAGVEQQAALLASGKISSRELTQLYLERLKRYDPLLKCVITLLEDYAVDQAKASDERRSRGQTRGILDGIPWVAKDLVAVPPWKTTWGAEPFREQVRPTTATVAEKLNSAGAILLAKVTLGALAWGDQWFGGMTRNPWNPKQGSSGSSAGSASAVAAGLATFALGSETLGSIVSPCTRCRTSGLRPTFGRVSRAGCMPLAWSMDKIGPIARHIPDLALIFPTLLGIDGRDPTLVERGYQWPVDSPLKQFRVGVTRERLSTVEQQALDFLQSAGAEVVEMDLSVPHPIGAMNFVLGTEATTVFDDAFREDRKADYGRWPSTFRQNQFTPAVQYLRANRMRSQAIVEAERKLSQVDVVLGANDLLLTNLTGHPSLVVACGEDKRGGIAMPGVVRLTAAAYQEQKLLHVAAALQQALPPRPSQPPLDDWLEKLEEEQAQASEEQDTAQQNKPRLKG